MMFALPLCDLLGDPDSPKEESFNSEFIPVTAISPDDISSSEVPEDEEFSSSN